MFILSYETGSYSDVSTGTVAAYFNEDKAHKMKDLFIEIATFNKQIRIHKDELYRKEQTAFDSKFAIMANQSNELWRMRNSHLNKFKQELNESFQLKMPEHLLKVSSLYPCQEYENPYFDVSQVEVWDKEENEHDEE
jgi:hypothetical protein